ncbi:hypothetical protein ACFOSV_15855 [Algoriphagus namhaensis]|uniref:Tetratricopeptide repeat protein n=1 Tax=Algoriphagus namhaensis TaxID=915353 RepID=A0ABV8AXK6_9BACT
MPEIKTKSTSFIYRNLLLLSIGLGMLALIYVLFFPGADYRIFTSSLFTDTIAVPFDRLDLKGLSIPLEVDNYLVFQEFKVSPALTRSQESLVFGLIFNLLAISGLALFTAFRKLYFVIGGILWILLMTLSNFNGLDIIAPSSNYSLIIIFLGTFLPTILIYIWGQELVYIKRWLIIFLGFVATAFTLFQLSPLPSPELFVSYHILVPAIGFSLIWLIACGHAIVSGIYILLARINQSIGIKISIQFLILSLIYLGILFAILLSLTGEKNLPTPTFNPLYLIAFIGVFGWLGVKIKSETDPELSSKTSVIQAIYLLGFALVLWTVWKLGIDSNEPGVELFKHILVYSQIAFSIFFVVYLLSNFLSIMDSGQAIDKVIYKPYSLPFYHVRIGGLIGLMVLTIYADGIIGVQVNSLSNNVLGDYYYASDQKLEASILYENSWTRYRKNGKAKQSVAQLLFELDQPTLAKQHLEESFAENPQIDNTILLAERLHRENKIFEAVFYLENGLNRFPKSPELANNLALFYTKLGRIADAQETLNSFADPISEANKLALGLKATSAQSDWEAGNTLIEKINTIPAQKLRGQEVKDQDNTILMQNAMAIGNPLLIEATLRNVFTSKSFENTSNDLALLDSLTRDPLYTDYIMSLQETASLRSLASKRIAESVKNLKGLAFRNPGDAAYYLQLSSSILALQLDFDKAAIDLLAALEKGFQNVQNEHLNILRLAGQNEIADSLRVFFELTENSINPAFLAIWADFHELMPQKGLEIWEEITDSESKISFGRRLIQHKSHGLTKSQIQRVAESLTEQDRSNEHLKIFLQNPEFTETSQLEAFMNWLNLGDELSANPYMTPLVLAAADRLSDPLAQYELLNAASEFNRDPILWIQKVNAARKIGLANYASAALEEMKNWIPEDELFKLQMTNF